ncbi:MAG TPA: DUF2884 family protein [Rhodanobacter sp.]
MRSGIAVLVLAIGLALSGQASADGIQINGDHCGFDTNYDVQAKPDGVTFVRSDGHPARVFMHDGQLRVDGQSVAVSATDAARLRQYEENVRTLLPEMAGVAQDAMGIAFDSLTTVAATLGGDADDRDALVKRLNRTHREALIKLDAGIGSDHWNEHGFEDAIETQVENAANELASSVSAGVLASLVTGKAGELEARADSLDTSIDKEMKARSGKLEARAKMLCPRLTELEQLEKQFGFRLADGSQLQLMTREHDGKKHQVADGDDQVTQR